MIGYSAVMVEGQRSFGMHNGGSAFFEPIREGFEKRCNDTGIEFHFRVSEDSDDCDCVCRRTETVREFIELGVDAIAMKPCGQEESIDFIQEAWDAGIPIVTFDSDSENSTRIAYVGTDQEFLGRTMARLLRQLKPDGGTFTVIGDKAGRREGFVEEITKHNGRKGKKEWHELDIGFEFQRDYYAMMNAYAPFNPTAFVSFKQSPMKDPNWTQFVDDNRFRNITYIGTDNADFQLEYLNRRYVNGLVGQLPYEIGVTAFNVLFDYLETNRQLPARQIIPTNLVSYNLIPLELPDVDFDQNLIGNLKYLGYTSFGVVGVAALACMIWTAMNRNLPVVKAAQPFFLYMVASGVLILVSAVLPLSFDDGGDLEALDETSKVAICMSVPWLAFSGFTITFSALFSKTWRVTRLFHANSSHVRIEISIWHVLAPFAVLMGCNVLVLTLWTILDPLTYTRNFDEGTDFWNRDLASYGVCQSDKAEVYTSLLAMINLSIVAIACWQAFEARSIKSEFSEAKYIGIAMFSVFQAFLTGIPVVIVARESPQAYYLVLTSMIFLLSMVLLSLIFIPKMVMSYKYSKMTEAEQTRRMQASIAQSSKSSYLFATGDGAGASGLGSRSAEMSHTNESDLFLPKRTYQASKIRAVVEDSGFYERLLAAMQNGILEAETGKFHACAVQEVEDHGNTLKYPTTITSGSFENSPNFVVSITNGVSSGNIQVYSHRTKQLEALMGHWGDITHMRNSAMGALAVKTLIPNAVDDVQQIGLLGTGRAAKHQLQVLQGILGTRKVVAWGENDIEQEVFMEARREEGWSIRAADDPTAVLQMCDLVIVTSSQGTDLHWTEEDMKSLKTRLIVNLEGARSERALLSQESFDNAALLVSDSVRDSTERGLFQGLESEKVVSLGAALTDAKIPESGVIVFDSACISLQDVVIAQTILQALSIKSNASVMFSLDSSGSQLRARTEESRQTSADEQAPLSV